MATGTLKLFNSASRKKEEFSAQNPPKVQMYCCGPTVYNYAHIGNLRTYVFEDFLRRVLEYKGYEVNHVVNITDVGHLTSDADSGEDKLEKGALREGKSVWEIAEQYTQEFQKDWKLLNLKEPSQWPKATDHIQEQIELIQNLEAKGYTYQIEDGLYFDTAKFPAYADFAKLDVANQEAGIRVSAEGKKSPTDFALWKFSPKDKQRAMEWKSPWGTGFPGWHVECSAMAMKHLGETLDIHCGGTDHLKVHHTNEIAQSECATGKKFARFWIHGGWLLESKEDGGPGKMSKSNDSFVRLATLIDNGFSALDYRFFCMTSHYRNYLNFSWDALESARDSLKKLRAKVSSYNQQQMPLKSELALSWREKFEDAIGDDLNIPKALGIFNSMLKDADLLDAEKGSLIELFDRVFGLDLTKSQEKENSQDTLPTDLFNLLEERKKARENKDFKKSDEIRDIFKDNGFLLKDSPTGTTWEKIV